MSKYNKQIFIDLQNLGLSYSQIAEKIGCQKSTVCYYLGNNQKTKYSNRRKRNRSKLHPYKNKIYQFVHKWDRRKTKQVPKSHRKIISLIYIKVHSFQNRKGNPTMPLSFDVQDVIDKFGETPVCYLTGKQIDIFKPKTYHFDHIIPFSRGGDGSLENLGICTKDANLAKRDKTPEEFFELCKSVLIQQGFKISK